MAFIRHIHTDEYSIAHCMSMGVVAFEYDTHTYVFKQQEKEILTSTECKKPHINRVSIANNSSSIANKHKRKQTLANDNNNLIGAVKR